MRAPATVPAERPKPVSARHAPRPPPSAAVPAAKPAPVAVPAPVAKPVRNSVQSGVLKALKLSVPRLR